MSSVLRTIRQPRYAALGSLMLLVAVVCTACGIWQVYRFEGKRDANDELRRNAHRPIAAVAEVLPVVGQGAAPSENSVEFRQVRATGRYDGAEQTIVRNRTAGGGNDDGDGDDDDDDTTGFLVLTPLRTSGATLLVVRGFLAQPSSGAIPVAPQPPAGRVTITARVQSAESRNDQYRELFDRQVSSINPSEQAARIGGEVYDGYAQLERHQPGGAGLHPLAAPDLSNPAGGALEPQHFAYVIQWFLFAALALAAPIVMARAETKRDEADDSYDDDSTSVRQARGQRARKRSDLANALAGESPTTDPDRSPVAAPRTATGDARAAKLAERYGR